MLKTLTIFGLTFGNSSGYPWRDLYSPANIPNWFLVGVGFWAGLMALRTLRAIDGQLKEMQKVSEIESKTLILQYRPKIIVRNVKALQFNFDLGKPWECEIRFQIVNTGGSPAHITTGSYIQLVSALGHDFGKIEMKWGDQCLMSSVTLEPGQGITVEEYLPAGVLFDLQWENFNQGVETQPLRYLYFTGVIDYADDLNIPRSTGIYRGFDPRTRDFIPKKESELEYSD
jgi:hypothetical protein